MTKSRTKIKEVLQLQAGIPVQVKGWVRTKRDIKNIHLYSSERRLYS